VIAIQKTEIAQECFLSLKRKDMIEVFFVHSAVWSLQLPILNESGIFNTYVRKWDSVMPILPYMELHVADACNLRCKGCSHFSNLIAGARNPSLQEYEESLKLLSEKFYSIDKLRLLGGEPLLNPELPQYVRIARKFFPLSDIRVVTNGLLVTSVSDELIDAMRENAGSFDISRYQPTSEKLPEIIGFLDRNRVMYHIGEPIETFWVRLCRGEMDYQEVFYHGCHNGHRGDLCRFLRGGRLYVCPFVPMLYEVKEYFGFDISEEEFQENGVDLADKDGWEILSRLYEPFTLCRYCADHQRTIPWSVGKASPEDWIV